MRIDADSVAGIAGYLLASVPARYESKLRMHDCSISVFSSSAAIDEALRDYYTPFFSENTDIPGIRIWVFDAPVPEFGVDLSDFPAEPGKEKIKEIFADIPGGRIAQKKETGLAFAFGNGIHLAVGPCLKNINQVINFINTRVIEFNLRGGGLLSHAAGVCRNGIGLAIAGFSGTGKSSLALKLVSRGTDFVSNDRLILLPDDHMICMKGVPKHPRVNPGTILDNPDLAIIFNEKQKNRYRELPAEALWHLNEKHDIRIDKLFPRRRFLLSAPLKGFAILNWKLSESPASIHTVSIDSRQDLLPALMKSSGVFYGGSRSPYWSMPSASSYIKTLSGCDVFEVSGGIDFEAVAEYFSRYLETGVPPTEGFK